MTSALLAAFAVALALPFAACGGSDKENSSTSQSGGTGGASDRPQGGPGAIAQDPKVAKCLRRQGVRLPQRSGSPGQGQGTAPQGPPDGQGPPNGQPPAGAPPASGGRPRASGQFKKLQSALKKCGVEMQAPPQGGQGAPPPATEQQNYLPDSGRGSVRA